MRSTDNSARVAVVQRLANATGVPPARTSASGNWRRYCGEKAPMEKRFSAVALDASQASETGCSSGSSSATRSAGTTSKLAPSRCALERELRERHPRLFADLEGCEPDIHVERQALARSLVEHRLGAVMVGHLAQ